MNKTDCILWCIVGALCGFFLSFWVTENMLNTQIELAAKTSGVYQLEHNKEGLSKAVYCKPVKVQARESKSYLDIYVESGGRDSLVTTVEVENKQ